MRERGLLYDAIAVFKDRRILRSSVLVTKQTSRETSLVVDPNQDRSPEYWANENNTPIDVLVPYRIDPENPPFSQDKAHSDMNEASQN